MDGNPNDALFDAVRFGSVFAFDNLRFLISGSEIPVNVVILRVEFERVVNEDGVLHGTSMVLSAAKNGG